MMKRGQPAPASYKRGNRFAFIRWKESTNPEQARGDKTGQRKGKNENESFCLDYILRGRAGLWGCLVLVL